MKNLTLSLFTIFALFNTQAQDLFKEVSEAYENGQPKYIDYLEMENLNRVKRELFNEAGDLIFSMSYNPETGLPDGEFFDLVNKGSFDNGVLNCEDCILVLANSPAVFTYNKDVKNTILEYGNIRNGRWVGEVNRYYQNERTIQGIDWDQTRAMVAAGAWVGYREVVNYGTGDFEKVLYRKYNYNENGLLDGEINLGYAKLNFENGIIKSYVAYDDKNLVIDSLSNSSKIWIVNYKVVKNYGFIVFKDIEEFNPPNYDYDRTINYVIYPDSIAEPLIAVGGVNYYSSKENFKSRHLQSGNLKIGLDQNGMYTEHATASFDAIIKYSYNFNGYYEYHFREGSNGKFFQDLYHYVMYPEKFTLQVFDCGNFEHSESYLGRIHFVLFLKSLAQKNGQPIEFNGNKEDDIGKNYFLKYLKFPNAENINFDFYQGSEVKYEDWSVKLNFIKRNGRYYYLQNDFFTEVISLSDYFIACKESIENKATEIQEIWVWDKMQKEYTQVNFDKLILESNKLNENISENSLKRTLTYFDLTSFEQWTKYYFGIPWDQSALYNFKNQVNEIVNLYNKENEKFEFVKDSLLSSEINRRALVIDSIIPRYLKYENNLIELAEAYNLSNKKGQNIIQLYNKIDNMYTGGSYQYSKEMGNYQFIWAFDLLLALQESILNILNDNEKTKIIAKELDSGSFLDQLSGTRMYYQKQVKPTTIFNQYQTGNPPYFQDWCLNCTYSPSGFEFPNPIVELIIGKHIFFTNQGEPRYKHSMF